MSKLRLRDIKNITEDHTAGGGRVTIWIEDWCLQNLISLLHGLLWVIYTLQARTPTKIPLAVFCWAPHPARHWTNLLTSELIPKYQGVQSPLVWLERGLHWNSLAAEAVSIWSLVCLVPSTLLVLQTCLLNEWLCKWIDSNLEWNSRFKSYPKVLLGSWF